MGRVCDNMTMLVLGGGMLIQHQVVMYRMMLYKEIERAVASDLHRLG